MDKKLAIATITATSAIIVALVSKLRLKDERDTISKNLAIYKLLPEESSIRKDLLKRIDENVVSSLIYNRSIRRDIPGTITTVIGAALGVAVALIILNIATTYNWNVPHWLPHWLSTAAFI